MEMETLKKGKALVEKCIEDLFKKNDLTPAETKAALDGMQLREMLCIELEDAKVNGEEGYSGYHSMPRHYAMTAYASDLRHMYPERRRDAMGRYAGDMDRSYGYDYSRHSIGDRAVEKLENLMDTAGSEYEREELRKFIRIIRQEAE